MMSRLHYCAFRVPGHLQVGHSVIPAELLMGSGSVDLSSWNSRLVLMHETSLLGVEAQISQLSAPPGTQKPWLLPANDLIR